VANFFKRVELERISQQDETGLGRPGYPMAPDYPGDYTYGHAEPDQGFQAVELLRKVYRHKWLVIIITAIVTFLAGIEAYRSIPTYQATAIVEIDKPNSMLGTQGADSDPYYLVNINTKIIMLRSRPLLEDVVVSLKLDQNPRFPDISTKKSFPEALTDLVRRLTGQKQIEVPSVDTKVPVLPSEPLTTSPSQRTRPPAESARLKRYVNLLRSGLAVDPIKDTTALRISFTHSDPAIAEAAANEIAQVFILRNFENTTNRFTRTSNWLDRSTADLKSKLQQAEQALANYTREHQMFSTEGKTPLTTGKLLGLHSQATKAEIDRMLKQSLYDEVKAGRVMQLPEAFSDARTTDLQKQLGELSIKAAQLSSDFGPDNPNVAVIRNQMAVIQDQLSASRKALEEKLKADYERAVRDETSLEGALERAKGEAVDQDQAGIQFNIIKQDVDTAKTLYTEFLQKTKQADLEVAQQHNNIRLIEPAEEPRSTTGQDRVMTILMGLMIGLATGAGLAIAIEYFDRTIKTVEDVNRYAQLPALSVIPSAPRLLRADKKKKDRKPNLLKITNTDSNGNSDGTLVSRPEQLIALDPRSPVAEAYRALRTSVLLSASDGPPKTILVTSGKPGEGKTTTTINTAISLAQLGASVLIIDCDLRKPAAHVGFGVDRLRGLSTYLSGDVDIDELIQTLQIPNLSLLPCGPIPSNPAELLSSAKMKSLLKMMAERYDHILLDSAPLIPVTDSVVLSTLVDGVILVVHGGKSTHQIVRQAREELLNVGANVFGVVLNNVDSRRYGSNDYRYHRFSDYGENPEETRISDILS